jgi:hypothetical protein
MEHVFLYLPVYLLEKSAIVQLSIHSLFWLIGALNEMKKTHYLSLHRMWSRMG